MIKIIECPRDAMQGKEDFIPTEKKATYINQLLRTGFNCIDFGSFVSPKHIPQLKDTEDVLSLLEKNSDTSLLAIVANERGAEQAVTFDKIDFLGFPFSVSETFQRRNANSTIQESLQRVIRIRDICKESNKTLVIYISMAFGNPYGDRWNLNEVEKWIGKLIELDLNIISLADTVGLATPLDVESLFGSVVRVFPHVEFGAHLHSRPDNWRPKIEAAYQKGCRRFDSALGGYGGCPMAGDELVGNMSTENLVRFFGENGEETGIDESELEKSINMAREIF